MKEINFNLMMATPHQAGHDLEEMKTFQELMDRAIKELQAFLAQLPPAPPGYKWTWMTTKDVDVLRLTNFRLIEL